MNKKFLSLVLALVMVLGTFGNVFAAAAPAKKEEAKKEAPKLTTTEAKTQWLIDNKIVIGNADADGKANGNMALTDPIRRDHVAKMLVFAMGEQDFAAKLQGVYRPFPDVELTSIVNGFISVAASKTSVNGVPIIAGYEDGTFRPTREVTYAELAKMLVVSIDKDLTPTKVKGMKWYSDWMKRAVELGILDGLSVDNPNAKAVRKDAFAMIYNAFFQLKEVKAVPANEMRGVISERSNGDKIVLNQDKAKVEYKVNDQTIFVNQKGVAQKWLANRNEQNNYYVGSVVRVLADKNGVATHVIEMGNPVVGIQNRSTAWVDLGNKTLNMVQSAWNPAVKDVKLNKDSLDVKKVNYEVNGKTEFYVADYDNNILTKVADYAAAKKLVADKANMTYNVYLAYEKLPTSGVREARVVVFNKAADVEANTRLVRVAKAVSSPDYLLQVNAPGEKETTLESFSTRNNDKVWPYNYNYNAFDVVKLAYSGNNVKGSPVKVIDYEKDNIYKVVDFKLVEGAKVTDNVAREKANQVVLADREGFVKKYDLPKEYNVFFGNQFTKGAHVQIATRDKTDIIDVVSVVQHDLRGHNYGEDTRLIKGVVANFLPANNKNELNRVEIIEEGNMRPTTFVTTLAEDMFAKGNYVEVRLGEVNKTYNYREILEVKKLHSSEADKKVAAKLQLVALEANKTVKADDANKTALEAVITEYNNVFGEAPKSADVNNIKALVNYFIAGYNKAQADKSKQLELIK